MDVSEFTENSFGKSNDGWGFGRGSGRGDIWSTENCCGFGSGYSSGYGSGDGSGYGDGFDTGYGWGKGIGSDSGRSTF